MLEKGQGQEFRGKTLDKININVDALVSDIEENLSEDDMNPGSPKLRETKEKAKNNGDAVLVKKRISSKVSESENLLLSKKICNANPKNFIRVS